MSDLHHEIQFIKAFVAPRQRRRLLAMMDMRAGPKRFRDTLAHALELEERYATKIPPNQQNERDILRLLKSRGAGKECYVISENSPFDSMTCALEDALGNTVGSGLGTILSCLPGKLAYYEGEERNVRYILRKKQ
jgi:hypothetical protein